MKKATAIMFVLLATLCILYGCQTGETASSITSEKAISGGDEAGETKLILWCYYEGSDRFQKIQTIISRFNTLNDDIQVTPEYLPFADFNKQLVIGYASGRAPDLAIIDNPVLAGFASEGMLEDLTDRIKGRIDSSLYFPAPWESCIYKSRVYGLPLGNNCLALFYNKDILSKAGLKPPKNWSELEKAARELTAGERFGLGITATLDEQGTFAFLPWMLSTGASLDRFDSPESVKALDFLSGLIKEGSMSRDILNWTPSDVLQQFIAGKIAMMVNGSWQIPELEARAPDLKYGVVDIPEDKKHVSVLGGENIVAISGPNSDKALKVLLFFEESSNLSYFSINFGYIPPRKDIASGSYWSDDPVWKVFKENVERSVPRGPDLKWPEKSRIIVGAFQGVLSNEESPLEAARNAQSKLEKVTG